MSFWGKLASLAAIAGGGVLTATGAGAPLGLALIGAGAGGAKHEWEDLPKEERQTKLAAETQRYAPWTGLQGKAPESSSGIGDVMAGATTGLTLGQGMTSAGLMGSAGVNGATGISTGAQAAGAAPSLGVDTNLMNYGNGAANNMTANLGSVPGVSAGGGMAGMISPDGVPLMNAGDANYGGLGGTDSDWTKLLKSKTPGNISIYS